MNSNEFGGGGNAASNAAPVVDGGNVREIYPGATALPPVVSGGVLRAVRNLRSELGMATAEYAIATLAAVGFAGLLVVILKSDEVRGFLLNIIRSALSF